MRITIQVFENNEPMGEHVANVGEVQTEQEAVDVMSRHLRIDLRYRFLGMHGFLKPSFPNDYMVQP